MPERLDNVAITLGRKTVVLGWPARDALLDEVAHLLRIATTVDGVGPIIPFVNLSKTSKLYPYV
jgi:hypothetical protein